MKKIWLQIISGKKMVVVLLACMILINISGCAPSNRLERMGKEEETYQEQSDETMQSIMNALKAKDAEKLKDLFSPYALEHMENIDEKIAELMDFYPGNESGYEGNCSMGGARNYGDITVILRGTYDVTGEEKNYEVRFIVIPQNDEEPEKEGLYLIEVMTEEAEPEGFKWRNEDDEPGIYVLEPQEKHW
ncbi:DUF5104 domain-containing protein [Roseburia sp. 499]|uniref:DUF5104 domain-containing protein n=1 Tax=Roseburia sp. 499 TaxID=1261634 RepID=UPI0009510774|nr:DUF5104 domain-containing protein [Roseburia sp. 499]WVK68909.1 DUF5104 domain-containing protein [Roseburia sp. 499]